ncbi:hypothetical protein B0T22DRAFT_68607 [Podospora appendiculata]|uniref:Uncharacterized protein n=1 Tax=Podospora appendiculata TaxID=314037 RepID=A0AAE0XK06_9PEZI|nr:hypothetical protein B0T22DRAFT_68607 [Podospora appendiculata]
MAVGLDRLERKFDQLKFFSRKRRTVPRELDIFDGGPNPVLPLLASLKAGSQTFPQPSFIRPTSTRMLARDEVILTPISSRRAQSLPEAPRTPRLISLASPAQERTPPTGCGSPEQPPQIPHRSSSLVARRRGASLAGLLDFSFSDSYKDSEYSSTHSPGYRSRSGSRCSTRPTSLSVSPKAQPDRKRHFDELQDDNTAFHQQYPTTPPLSARNSKPMGFMEPSYQKELPAIPAQGNPTPEASPRLIPLPEPELNELGVDEADGIESQKLTGFVVPIAAPDKALSALRRSISESTLSTLHSQSKNDQVLKEPSFSDFLSLSDDDIADDGPRPPARLPATSTRAVPMTRARKVSNPPIFSLPPDPPSTASSPTGSRYHAPGPQVATKSALSPRYQFFTPSPSESAATAAFEAARIAARYRFDLVYVVSLWPSNLGYPQRQPVSKQPSSSSLGAAATVGSHDCTPKLSSPSQFKPATHAAMDSHIPRAPMTGRLLAAAGLSSLQHPFRISVPVHQKVLRSDGWLEYRSESIVLGHFVRGYTCSFGTGHIPDGMSPPNEVEGEPLTPEEYREERKAKEENRGIVFAAYRLPRPDGSEIGSDHKELEALRKDAEALVDMLIDIGEIQRQRQRQRAGI